MSRPFWQDNQRWREVGKWQQHIMSCTEQSTAQPKPFFHWASQSVNVCWDSIFWTFGCRMLSASLSSVWSQKKNSSPVSLVVSLKMCLMFLFNDAQNQLWWLVFSLLTGGLPLLLFPSVSIALSVSISWRQRQKLYGHTAAAAAASSLCSSSVKS